MDGLKDGWMGRWMDGLKDGWMGRWMDGFMDVWMHGYIERQVYPHTYMQPIIHLSEDSDDIIFVLLTKQSVDIPQVRNSTTVNVNEMLNGYKK